MRGCSAVDSVRLVTRRLPFSLSERLGVAFMSGVSTDATDGGAVRAHPVPPLVVAHSGSQWRLPADGTYVIGRDPGCAVVVPDARVSRRHAVVRVDDGHWQIVDDGSANGVFAGDDRVERMQITAECVVRLADPASGPTLRLFVPEGSEPVSYTHLTLPTILRV